MYIHADNGNMILIKQECEEITVDQEDATEPLSQEGLLGPFKLRECDEIVEEQVMVHTHVQDVLLPRVQFNSVIAVEHEQIARDFRPIRADP